MLKADDCSWQTAATRLAERFRNRRIAEFKGLDLAKMKVWVSTIWALDWPGAETALRHPLYNDGGWVIVAEYSTGAAARKGHAAWVARVTTETMPPCLIDVSSCPAAKFRTAVTGVEWRRKERTEC